MTEEPRPDEIPSNLPPGPPAYSPPVGYEQPGYQQPSYAPPPTYQQPGYQQPGYQQPYQPGVVAPILVAGQQKDWLITLLLCIFVGYLGVHSFYTGKIVFGVIQLLTLGGCGIWTLVDLIMIITDNYRDSNGLPLLKK